MPNVASLEKLMVEKGQQLEEPAPEKEVKDKNGQKASDKEAV